MSFNYNYSLLIEFTCMKKIIFIFCFITLHFSGFCFANSCEKESLGNSQYLNSTKECINHVGKLTLANVVVTNQLDMTGKLIAKNVVLNDIVATGKILFEKQSLIKGKIDLVGKLIANNSSFLMTLNIVSDHIELNAGTTTKDILIGKNARSKTKKQILYIDNSTVNGNIKFTSGIGEVVIRNGGSFTGNLTGGTVRK